MTEIYFICKGQYDIGFEVNKKEIYILRQPESTVIGGFECSYEKRSSYNYRAWTPIQAYFLRKRYWRLIEKNYPEFHENLKRDFLKRTYSFLQPIMSKAKEKEKMKYASRSDYQQIMVSNNINKSEIERIVMNEYNLNQIRVDNIIDFKGNQK